MIEYLVFVILTDEPLLNIMPVSSFFTVICDVFCLFQLPILSWRRFCFW